MCLMKYVQGFHNFFYFFFIFYLFIYLFIFFFWGGGGGGILSSPSGIMWLIHPYSKCLLHFPNSNEVTLTKIGKIIDDQNLQIKGTTKLEHCA